VPPATYDSRCAVRRRRCAVPRIPDSVTGWVRIRSSHLSDSAESKQC
jgi:hypothetical protein